MSSVRSGNLIGEAIDPRDLDVATDIGKAAKESLKVTIMTIILKNMSWTWWGGGLSHENERDAHGLA